MTLEIAVSTDAPPVAMAVVLLGDARAIDASVETWERARTVDPPAW